MSPDQAELVERILEGAMDLVIATVRPDGWPQATTASFVSDGLHIYFGASPTSQKAVNIAHEPRVSCAISAPYRTWTEICGLSFAARAEFVSDTAELMMVNGLMASKFGADLAQRTSAATARTCIVRLKPEKMSLIDYSKGYGHAALITLSASDFPHAAARPSGLH